MVSVSVVVPSRDVRRLAPVLRALAAQDRRPDEVLLAGPPGLAPPADEGLPVRVVEGSAEAAARAAASDVVVLLAEDALPDPAWLASLLTALADADVAFGRRVHAPAAPNPATVARGLRYHVFAKDPPLAAESYASDANAAWRREVLLAVGPEDATPARRVLHARALGARVVYAPDAVVRQEDVADARSEWRRVRSEARAAGEDAQDGRRVDGSLLLWGGAALGAVLAALLEPAWTSLAFVLAVIWAPTARRILLLRPRQYRARDLLAGALVMPLFDVGRLVAYVAGLTRRAAPRGGAASA